MLHRRRVSSGDRRKMVLIKAHHREVGHLLGHKLPIESCARDIHPPELPVDGVTAKFERVTRNRSHQRAPRTTAASSRAIATTPAASCTCIGRTVTRLTCVMLGHTHVLLQNLARSKYPERHGGT